MNRLPLFLLLFLIIRHPDGAGQDRSGASPPRNVDSQYLTSDSQSLVLMEALEILSEDVKRLEKERLRLSGAHAKAQAKLADMDQKMEELDKKVTEQREKARKLIRAAVRLKAPSELNLLLSSGRYHDLMIYQRTVTRLLGNIRQRIERVAFDKARWESLRTKASHEADLLRENEQEAARLLADTEKELDSKSRRLKERQDSIAAVNSLFMVGLGEYGPQRSEGALAGPAPAQQKLPGWEFQDLKGKKQLRLPLSPGRIAKPFDKIPTDGVGTEKMGKGIILVPWTDDPKRMPDKASVQALYDGLVVWSGNIPGFGMTLVLKHGTSYHTVYSNLYKVNFEKGQKVNALDELGIVKTFRKDQPPYLYFELRENRASVDPKPWFRLRPMKE